MPLVSGKSITRPPQTEARTPAEQRKASPTGSTRPAPRPSSSLRKQLGHQPPLFIKCLRVKHSDKTSSPAYEGSRLPQRSPLSVLLPTLEGHCFPPSLPSTLYPCRPCPWESPGLSFRLLTLMSSPLSRTFSLLLEALKPFIFQDPSVNLTLSPLTALPFSVLQSQNSWTTTLSYFSIPLTLVVCWPMSTHQLFRKASPDL